MDEQKEALMPEDAKEPKWYAVHTYSGYENKVKSDIEKTVANRQLENPIVELFIPTEMVSETRENSKGEMVTKQVERKRIPCYVFIKMVCDKKNWYIVRNTRGVTGFVGPNPSEPTPLPDEEMAMVLGTQGKVKITLDCEVGDEIVVTSGAWVDTEGRISAINTQKQTVTIMVPMFGRETPVDLAFTEIRKKESKA